VEIEIICLGSRASISKIWHGLHDSGRLILLRLQSDGTQAVATFTVLSEYADTLS
jgi:hypothetical protein